MRRISLLIILITMWFAINCAETEDTTLKFMVQWFPQSQFAGYIAAVEEGYFEQEGINIELLFNDGNSSALELIDQGEIDLCSAWLSQAMKERDEGVEIVHILQILQKSSLMMITQADSGIKTPEDMNGKRISMWGNDFSLLPNAFLAANQIKAEIIPQAYTIETLLAGACDISLAMYYNEYYQIILAGKNEDELNTFFFSDYGLNFPEDGIYIRESLFEESPDMIEKLKRAILKGWDFTSKNPETSLEYVMRYCRAYNMQTNLAQQKWMLNVILSSITADNTLPAEQWGRLSVIDYNMVGNEMKRQNLIGEIPKFHDFIKGQKSE